MAGTELNVEVDHSQVDEGIVVVRMTGEIDTATAPISLENYRPRSSRAHLGS